MDEAVEGYRTAYPAAIPWHHDLGNQYLHHSVVKAVENGDGLILIFDNGLKAMVTSPAYLTTINASQGQGNPRDPVAAHLPE